MASNLFLLKGWTITLIAALFALAAKDSDRGYFLIAYLPALMFWTLDGYFLSQERRFRALYDQVRKIRGGRVRRRSLEDSANLAGLKRVNPACPASLDTLKVSVPPAVKLAAAIRARPAPDPDIIAAEIDSQISLCSPFGLPVHVGCSHDLH